MAHSRRQRLYSFVSIRHPKETSWNRLKRTCKENHVQLNLTYQAKDNNCIVFLNGVSFGVGAHSKRSIAKSLAIEETNKILDAEYPSIMRNAGLLSANRLAERQPEESLEQFLIREFREFTSNPTLEGLFFPNIEDIEMIQQMAFQNGFQSSLQADDMHILVSRSIDPISVFHYLKNAFMIDNSVFSLINDIDL